MNRFFVLLAVLFVSAGGVSAQQAKSSLTYARDVQPILATHCFNCHGADKGSRKAGLRLDTFAGATANSGEGQAFVPGHPETSEAIRRIFAEGKGQMPPAKIAHRLTAAEKETLKRWVQEGAVYQKHWAFEKPKSPPLPNVANASWVRNPIDRFVLARLEKLGWSTSPEADRFAIARRVALDLTGLPPKLDLVDRFVADKSPDAYEKYVDEIMQSPAYGERWAAVWLDLARYADSNGYATDGPRSIWRYRDWVIRAFNANQPFDEFTIDQLAGDMKPGATPNQILATAFHRNTLTQTEGGTNDEEFRNVAVVDRVNTTLQVWMGVTVNCAQCHDHKYDPISQEEYFKLFAIFNQSEDSDRDDNSPNLPQLDPDQEKRRSDWERDLAAIDKAFGAMPDLEKRQTKWQEETAADKELREKTPKKVLAALFVDPAKRSVAQKAELTNYFRSITPETAKLQAEAVDLKAKIASTQPIMTPIMKELPPARRRITKIHVRGDWLSLGKEVQPGFPAELPPLSKDPSPNRLALAEWLVSPENPLTSRVAVNRLWDQLFGISLVETPEDFGMRSPPPLHPELLDYLASEFQGPLKWDMKKLLKLMVTSATYRQSSKVTAAQVERDPDNRFFAHGPRFRSSAEVIRDQALAVGGLLSPKMYGASVRPPQPKLGLTAAFGGGTDWANSSGEDKFRRALYTQWRRTTPYPSMITFDAPGKTVCTLTRARTNTPLQALVTLNDPCYVEAAQALARRMVAEGGKSPAEQIAYGFRLALIRPPHADETARLTALLDRVRGEMSQNPKDAEVLATDPLGPLPRGMNAVELAAYTVVANVILNLDETFVKR
jgi:mono/diheme cytochrome c family protein